MLLNYLHQFAQLHQQSIIPNLQLVNGYSFFILYRLTFQEPPLRLWVNLPRSTSRPLGELMMIYLTSPNSNVYILPNKCPPNSANRNCFDQDFLPFQFSFCLCVCRYLTQYLANCTLAERNSQQTRASVGCYQAYRALRPLYLQKRAG